MATFKKKPYKTFLLISSKDELPNVITSTKKLIEVYQNSTAIVVLISQKPINTDKYHFKNINIIHYPSNRSIDAHFIMIKFAKIMPHSEICFLGEGGYFNLNFKSYQKHNSYVKKVSNGLNTAFLIDSNALVKSLKQDITTANTLKKYLQHNHV
ncbi:hypothetical protein GCM10011365_05510 [Marinicella pacifica]|uniref:Uncharacterized protein n=1 Tax=Marinicella pacifica TaxID=1171543 RepID=A0A917FIK8_9GAMM|nr:hypothetical protein GCM10011365_05510 [Marinicella pacifica]